MKSLATIFLGYLSDFVNGTPRRISFFSLSQFCFLSNLRDDPDVVSYKNNILSEASRIIEAHEQQGESKGEESQALANAYYHKGLFQEFDKDLDQWDMLRLGNSVNHNDSIYKDISANYDKAIALNHAGAMVRRALVYHKFGIVNVDPFLTRFTLLNRAVQLQDTEAMTVLSGVYRNESWKIIPEINPDQARSMSNKLLREASDWGDAEAMACLGKLYEGEQYQEAIELYEQAIGLGSFTAMEYRAETYRYKEIIDGTCENDYANAIRLYDKATALGDWWSQNCRKKMFKQGEGTDRETMEKLLELIWPDLFKDGYCLSEETIKSFKKYPDLILNILNRVKTEIHLKGLKTILSPEHAVYKILAPTLSQRVWSLFSKSALDEALSHYANIKASCVAFLSISTNANVTEKGYKNVDSSIFRLICSYWGTGVLTFKDGHPEPVAEEKNVEEKHEEEKKSCNL